MLKGMTVHYLLHKTFKVERGHTVPDPCRGGRHRHHRHAMAHSLGAIVIGTVGSEEKAEIARANGCDHVILYRHEDFAARVKEITGGHLCDVVYDGVGKDTFPGSLDIASSDAACSSASAMPSPRVRSPISASPNCSAAAGLPATRPVLGDYIHTRSELVSSADETFAAFIDGTQDVGQPPLRAGRTPARPYAEDLRGPQDHRPRGAGAVILEPRDGAVQVVGVGRARSSP